MFDSLNRKALGAYGGTEIATPNFDRFAARAQTFDQHYAGSLPCMPARRDLHTGRLNFMHRSWGPLEPFDNSFADILGKAGVQTRLTTDHLHYFEDGGSTYHGRFTGYDFIRGQEYDNCNGVVEPDIERYRKTYASQHYPFNDGQTPTGRAAVRIQHAINNDHILEEADYPGVKCFDAGLNFLESNKAADNWLLMLECFDPHEPFKAPERFKAPYRTGWNGGVLDWPLYAKDEGTEEERAEVRANYAALVAMCDAQFGRLLDWMDANDMWKDTALILSTDHGFLLSEHEWWGKNLQPYYQEISHTPLMVHDPRAPERAGTRSHRLTQTHDLMPSILDLFGVTPPPEVQGTPVWSENKAREVAVFGMFGGPIGASDGNYTCYIYPEDLYGPGLHEYTLMPMHVSSMFEVAEMQTARLRPPFDFTKGMPVMQIDALMSAARIPMHDGERFQDTGTRIYNLASDPEENHPLRDDGIEERIFAAVSRVLQAHDAPDEIYTRYGLNPPARASHGGQSSEMATPD
ncbi:sulfatase [Martelella soudanensis]|uniref:sulfatase n=1 Tax=Martelella sp. NC20 TaxID=2740298 RepID=UPI001FEE9970|nr:MULTISPECIES: sulfatase [unclassified Martelella]